MSGPVGGAERELHGTIDLTYQGKFVWRGFDVFGDKSAVQTGIDLDLYGTGFGVSAQGHRANSSGFENAERWDYTLYYSRTAFEDKRYFTIGRLNWVYYSLPDNDKNDFDLQEIWMGVRWPKVLGIKGLVPGYVRAKCWPSSSGSRVGSRSVGRGTASGWVHIFILDYSVPLAGIGAETPEQVLKLHTDVTYNDGVGLGGQDVDHDWSHALFGVSMDFDLGGGFTLTPGVWHQVTMDKSVNADKDETWVSVGASYRF
ncbi:MAG: hypothetical protein JW720_07405 [Sedimentisphaerales bacterium]|nr:hypothetical protein [Sedimentisphaerales bacterium]